ncbi:hypothetical protein [Mucilaginibacter polytrichastri]|uniref:Uncharacterized protein n=1 Tax=Mucilaginibacter polytrichastri TaxID=1302689 RepID=A0A1Q6A1P3_9SPHI|nr:hypothetical protein [Mucilaginibacter polytrichastri]OKS87935.1 hypothetical protein RG47T_3399 [Mucilaginibacter polytrichastri]SFT23251.1 hypothetical protein SAMN04487890_12038 [Mucilaginibacter polytrichastri]
MKIEKIATVTKLVNRFDNELRAILQADLIAVKRTKNELIEKIAQSVQGKNLSAA